MPILLSAVLRMAFRRAASNRRLVVAMVIGVVLAVGLMASTAIYRDALDDLGFKFDLGQATKSELDLRVSSTTHLTTPAEYNRDQTIVDRELDQLSDLLQGRTRIATSATFFLTEPGLQPTEAPDRPRSRFQFLTDLEQHIAVDAGHLPAPAVATGEDGTPSFEVALGTVTAEALGVAVGDVFDLHPFWRPDKDPVTVTVVGLISPRDYDEEYWRLRRDHFRVDTQSWDTYPFFVPEETFSGAIASYLPDMTADLETLAYVDLGALSARNAEETSARLQAVAATLRGEIERARVETTLPTVLDDFSEKQFFSRVPLLVLTLQVVGIILYYLVMVATMLVDRQS
ncbi:MAG: hypothetical protein V3V06_02460, partial [Dehalococcoidia bacterium]